MIATKEKGQHMQGHHDDDDIKIYRKAALNAAKDLHYDRLVIAEIEDAKTTDDISVIMHKARYEKFR